MIKKLKMLFVVAMAAIAQTDCLSMTMCTVKFDLNVYDSLYYFVDEDEDTRLVEKGSSIGELPMYWAPSLFGVGFGSFQGWYTAKAGGKLVTEDTIVNGNVTYFGHWIYYRFIEFEFNGGELSDGDWFDDYMFAESGKAIGTLPVPVREGYKFDGWYTSANGGTKVTENTVLTATESNIIVPVKYYARWTHGTEVRLLVADGCEAMGKVSGGKMAKAGTKLTLKATANKGYVFAGWDGPLDESVNHLSPSVTYVVGEDDAEFIARFIPIKEDGVEVWFEELNDEYETNGEIGDIYVGLESGSLATVKVTGLPAGLKFTDKAIVDKKSGDVLHEANTIYGTPTKSGVYTVTATATSAGKKTATSTAVIVVRKPDEKMVKLLVENVYDEDSALEVVPGKVTGAGIYAEGKKISLKATANKGFVFAGWWDVNAGEWIDSAEDYRNPKLSYVMTDSDMELEAVFVPVTEDTTLELYVEGDQISEDADDNVFYADGEVEVRLEIDSLSLPKATVSGLPKGLKFDSKTNMITGAPTTPGVYEVTVKLTNQSIKKAIVRKFKVEVSNLKAANDYFEDCLYNDDGEKYTLSVGISNIDEFLPSLRLNRNVKLAVSGLPAGLKYNAKTGKITGVATKAGVYTVTLTVTDGKEKYVSTITIEVEALPDWVVGTFDGYLYCTSDHNWDYHDKVIITISSAGKVSCKGQVEDTSWYVVKDCLLIEDAVKGYVIVSHEIYNEVWDETFEEYREISIVRKEICGQEIGCLDGFIFGWEMDEGSWSEISGFLYACQNVWKMAKGTKLAVEFVKNTTATVSMDDMRDDEWDSYYGGSLTLKFGSNGAVTTAYSEYEGGKATATGSAQLVPYEVDGDTVRAWLYTALKPKGREPFGVLLFLSIDTSRGIVYGSDVSCDDYLLEVDD